KTVDKIEQRHMSQDTNQGANQRNNEQPGDTPEQLCANPAVVAFAESVAQLGDGKRKRQREIQVVVHDVAIVNQNRSGRVVRGKPSKCQPEIQSFAGIEL